MQEKEQREIMTHAITLFGEESQTGVAMEECAELIQAISKIRRKVSTVKGLSLDFTNLIEEIADVRIMIAQLIIMYELTEDEIDVVTFEKLGKLRDKIAELGDDSVYAPLGYTSLLSGIARTISESAEEPTKYDMCENNALCSRSDCGGYCSHFYPTLQFRP